MEVNEFIMLVINNASQMNLYEKMLHVGIHVCDIRNYYGVFFFSMVEIMSGSERTFLFICFHHQPWKVIL